MSGLKNFPTPNRLIKFLYSIGLGFLLGRIVLLLTTKGRRTGLPRTTPLQYEELDGKIYVMSAKGPRSDWYRNILVNPRVEVRVGTRCFEGLSEATTDQVKIADLLELRLEKSPWMVGRILEADGLSRNPSRADLEEYSTGLAMVAIKPIE